MTASMTTVAAVSVAGAIPTTSVATNIPAKTWIIKSHQFRCHGPIFRKISSRVEPDYEAEDTDYAGPN